MGSRSRASLCLRRGSIGCGPEYGFGLAPRIDVDDGASNSGKTGAAGFAILSGLLLDAWSLVSDSSGNFGTTRPGLARTVAVTMDQIFMSSGFRGLRTSGLGEWGEGRGHLAFGHLGPRLWPQGIKLKRMANTARLQARGRALAQIKIGAGRALDCTARI